MFSNPSQNDFLLISEKLTFFMLIYLKFFILLKSIRGSPPSIFNFSKFIPVISNIFKELQPSKIELIVTSFEESICDKSIDSI